MDDASLEKLSISSGKLSPKFNREVKEYAVTVGSNVKELKVNPLTNDSNACYSISGGNGGKIVPLQEGQVTIITIEVTAEDGTIQNYIINATRLSASDASLSNITISTGCLSPSFDPKCTQYTVVIPYHVSSIQVKPIVIDKTTTTTLRDQPNDNISLYFGETQILIDVTSPDKTTTNTYHISILRKKPQWPISFIDKANCDKFSCPLCLGVLHYPRSIRDTKHIFCKHCINELTKTVKKDPLNEQPLTGDWQITEEQLEKDMSSSGVQCVYERYGCTEKMNLMELGSHMKQCEHRLCLVGKSHELCIKRDFDAKTENPVISCPDCNLSVRPLEVDNHKKHLCTAQKSTNAKNETAKVTTRNWEKKLQQETSEKSVEKLVKIADEQLDLYFKSLQVYVQTGHCNHLSTPINHLKQACETCATAINLSPKDAKLHFKLGQICEELYYAEDWYGLKQEGDEEIESIDFNQQSRDSSKEDDIQAICEQRGVGRNAPLALQLKAIDEEYHYLLDNQQSDRCEYVQKLYAWKSKQAAQDGKSGQKAVSDEEGWFGKACVKYNDALFYSPDDYLYYLHAGRFLLLQRKHEQALQTLQNAVGLKPVHIEARFFLGLALLECSNSDNRRAEGLDYVHEGLEHLLYKLNTAAEYDVEEHETIKCLQSDDLLTITNIQCLQGFLTLGKTLLVPSKLPSHFMSAYHIFRCVATMTIQGLCVMVNKGEMYHQLEWCLLQAHYNLLQGLLEEHKNDSNGRSRDVIIEQCENLTSLINVLSLPRDKTTLELQEKTCQQGVILQPNNSKALWLLGNAQLGRYDNDVNNTNSEKCLSEAEQCFRVSLQLEEQPSRGGVVCDVIKEQDWWKQRHTTTYTTTTTTTTSTTRPGNQRVSPTKNTITKGRGRANAVTSKNPTTKPVGRQPASKPPPTMTSSPSKTFPAGNTSRKNSSPKTTSTGSKPTSTSKQPVTKPAKQNTPSKTNIINGKPNSKAPSRVCSHTETTTKKVITPSTTAVARSTQDAYGTPNTPSYHARLGLARVLSRRRDAECETFYHEVIKMCPTLHDAYIELGDILVKKDPLGAVDVYSRYPFPDPLTYDDAFLHGEIVRHLVKQEKFEDERLSKSLIALGKVMGLSVIEKYVDIIDSKLKYRKILMEIYAGVHGKNVDDPDLQNFFRFKCWI